MFDRLSEKQHTVKHVGYTYPGDELLGRDYDSFHDIKVDQNKEKKPFTTALVAASIVREVVNRTVDGNGTLKLKELDAYVWTALQRDVKNNWDEKSVNVKHLGHCTQYKNDNGGYILPFWEAEPRLALLGIFVKAVLTNIHRPLMEKIISEEFCDRGYTAGDVRNLLLDMIVAMNIGHASLVLTEGPFRRAVPDNSNSKGSRKRENCDTEQGTSKRAKAPSATRAKTKKTSTISKQGTPKKAKAKKASTREDPASSSTAGDHAPSGVDVTSLMARLEKVENENLAYEGRIATLESEVKSLKEKRGTEGEV